MITIENDLLRAQFHNRGAELCSLLYKPAQKELLWQADPVFWARHAPVLFPIVGRLKNDSYTHEGRLYKLPQHGFARDMIFTTVHVLATEVNFALEHNPDTLQLYPFPFRLLLKYALHNMTLRCSYEVQNTGNNTLYFSIGAHPGFACSFEDNKTKLIFGKDEKAERWLLEDGYFTGATQPLLDGNSLVLTEKLFRSDALVFKHLQSDRVMLQQEGHKTITLTFTGFPFLGIWKKPGAPFLCIEPWYGIADHVHHNGELKEKEGIQALPKGDIFTASYQIIIE